MKGPRIVSTKRLV